MQSKSTTSHLSPGRSGAPSNCTQTLSRRVVGESGVAEPPVGRESLSSVCTAGARLFGTLLLGCLTACGGGSGGGSEGGGNSGGEDGDTQAPMLSDVSVTVLGSDRVSVEWSTDEPASATVEYGSSASLGASAGSSSLGDLEHVVVLDGLAPSSLYHFVVRSADANGNLGSSDPMTFNSGNEGGVTLAGQLIVWHPLTLTLAGPAASETDDQPNPFLDYRLQVEFSSPSGVLSTVPGYFAGDGQGASSGDQWRAHLAPDEAGQWTWTARFRSGTDVALSLQAGAGQTAAFDGESGTFSVQARDSQAPGFLKWGRLESVGGHYRRFRDGPYFLKTGLSSPENLLAYAGFDGTADQGGSATGGLNNGLHQYQTHVGDWGNGGLGSAQDPNFGGQGSVDAKGLIGALNYLSSRGVNSLAFQVMNLGGDGDDTSPYVEVGTDEIALTHFDLSKLDQWNVAFRHAQELGIALQLVLSDDEASNVNWLDGGQLGRHRALLMRELVARFGHLLALEWNSGERASLGSSGSRGMTQLLNLLDPQGHGTGVSSADLAASGDDDVLDALLGSGDFVALAGDAANAGAHVEKWRAASSQAGVPWVVTHATQDPASNGFDSSNADLYRRSVLWDVLLSGGQIELSAASSTGADLTLEDFRTRQILLDNASAARGLLESTAPFWEMSPADELLTGESSTYGGGEVLAKHDEVYLIYLPVADQVASIDLTGTNGSFNQTWFNPRSGQFEGNATVVQGGAVVSLGSPPDAGGGGTDGAFQEEDGLVVMQVESATRVNFWGASTSLPGFTGKSYYRWYGIDQFNNPGVGVLSYEIDITNADTYFVSLYNYHDDPEADRENDCWVRMDGGTWYKVYSNLGSQTVGVWNWSSRFDHTGQDAKYVLSAGTHTFEISGRSTDFHIDRIHLHESSVGNPFDLNLPESSRSEDGDVGSDQDWVIALTK